VISGAQSSIITFVIRGAQSIITFVYHNVCSSGSYRFMTTLYVIDGELTKTAHTNTRLGEITKITLSKNFASFLHVMFSTGRFTFYTRTADYQSRKLPEQQITRAVYYQSSRLLEQQITRAVYYQSSRLLEQ
jgi:hypothetical protein